MIRIGILGDIGSGKSYIANNFGYPVFDADYEVSKLYLKNKEVFNKLNKQLPEYIFSFPIKKNQKTEYALKPVRAEAASVNAHGRIRTCDLTVCNRVRYRCATWTVCQ